MRTLMVLPFIAMTFLSWGLYGPLVHLGQYAMGDGTRPSSLRTFICVGVAYFLIAVVVPLALLWGKGETGRWTIRGAFWSFAAGAAGAFGALGIILAFKFRGSPIFVMPLVFGLAPVVNTFVTMWLTKTFKQASAVFFAGVILVAVGAAGVLFFKPPAVKHSSTSATRDSEVVEEASESPAPSTQPPLVLGLLMVPLSVALSAVCWGSYGPVLHKGQMKMEGSRLRPFLCVGLAYFAIAVLAPLPLLKMFQEPGGWSVSGTFWSLAGGTAGAVGALGIVLAFNFGGKPIYVMPLVFGGAPVVNTLTTTIMAGALGEVSPLFYLSIALVIGGAVTVLIFSPRHPKKKSRGEKEADEKPAGIKQQKHKPEETSPKPQADLRPGESGPRDKETEHASQRDAEPDHVNNEVMEETYDPDETIDRSSR